MEDELARVSSAYPSSPSSADERRGKLREPHLSMPTAVIGQPLLLMTAAEGWLGPAAGDRNDVGVHPDTATSLLSLIYIPHDYAFLSDQGLSPETSDFENPLHTRDLSLPPPSGRSREHACGRF